MKLSSKQFFGFFRPLRFVSISILFPWTLAALSGCVSNDHKAATAVQHSAKIQVLPDDPTDLDFAKKVSAEVESLGFSSKVVTKQSVDRSAYVLNYSAKIIFQNRDFLEAFSAELLVGNKVVSRGGFDVHNRSARDSNGMAAGLSSEPEEKIRPILQELLRNAP